MKRIGISITVSIALLCLFLCTPALADYNFDGWSVETRLNGAINGGVFIDYEPWDGSRDLSLNTTVPNGTVKWAHLYTGIWGGREYYKGWVNVTFNGVADQKGLGPILLEGEDDTNQHVWCTSHGKYWMFYNVTELVDAGTLNTARVRKINETYGAFDGRVYGIVLIVIYEDGDNPKNIQYWINDGNDAFHYADATWPPIAHDTGTTYFNGTVDVANVTRANLTVVHLTAYDPSCSTGLTFNDHSLNTSMVDSNTFDLNTWDVASYVTASENLVWYTRCEDEYINVPLAILTLEKSPDLIVTAIKPYHYQWSEDYSCAMGEPWFNLTNYVNVTVYNNGTGNVGPFAVNLYANETQIGAESVNGLSAGAATEVKFEWKPEGEDPLSWIDTAEGAICAYTDTSKEYALRAVVDEGDEVSEDNEENNELTREQKVVWNGFAADEPLEVYAHDVINGGVIVTTGDAVYRSDDTGDSGTVYGKPYEINYNLQIPGSTQLARFYLYYTWAEPAGSVPKAPKIDLTVQTPGGTSTKLSLDASYNEIKGDFLNFRFNAWGTYAYDVTNYVRENGTYVVTVENINDGSDEDFTEQYSFAAPALLVVYEDVTAPKREYWINEGADVLMGGREIRYEGGFLGLKECLNTAEFSGEHLDWEVEEAVLGVISPWADDAEDDVIIFNGVAELGKGLYNGYYGSWSSSEELQGISMYIGADEAQQGMAAIDVTEYLEDEDNEVIQGDDGDNMMPANAFLVITYNEKEEDGHGSSSGSSGSTASTTDTTTATATPTPSSASATPTAVVTKASRTIPLLEAGIERAMIFQDMVVSLLALVADTNVSDAKVVVKQVEKPYEIPQPSGIPYVYLDIRVQHEEETATIKSKIEFKASKSWLTAKNIDEATVTLNRYHERDGWIALPTSKVGEEGNATMYFEAETTDFSIFAITAEAKLEPASTPSPRTVPPLTSASPTPFTLAAQDGTKQNSETNGASVPGFELAIALCMLIGGAYLLLVRKKDR